MGNPEKNRATADELLSKADLAGVSAILLPEMIFSGYVFSSKDEIGPFCEIAEEHDEVHPIGSKDCTCGETVKWAHDAAQRHNCPVQAGFPRRDAETGKFYNSLCLVEPNGACVIYDKTHLYYTDESWSDEGKGFRMANVSIDSKEKKVAFAICMDINPYKFQAPWDAFELASFHAKKEVDILFGSMAWCGTDETIKEELRQCGVIDDEKKSDKDWESSSDVDSEEVDEVVEDEDTSDSELPAPKPKAPPAPIDPLAEPNHGPWPASHVTAPSTSTLNYWANRLSPFIERPKDTIVAIANRTGSERGTTFLGSSAVMILGRGRAVLVKCLGRGEQTVLITNVQSRR